MWRRRRPKQFQTLRQAHHLRHRSRRPPNCRRVRASVRVSGSYPAQCAGSPAAPSCSALGHELSLRSHFFAEIPERPFRQRKRARLDREILLPAVLPSLPYGEWQFPLRRFCSTIDLDGAQWCPCKQAPRHRDPSALLPIGARDALPLRPCAKECLCVFRRAHVPRDRGKFARSRLQPASCALQHRSFADDLSARRPCRIKAQGAAVSNPPFATTGGAERPPLLDPSRVQSAGSSAALKAGSTRARSCCAVIISATEPMIRAAATNMRTVTVSPAKKVPSRTATIGFTYA